MNKKFLSAILFGALMVTSTGTFVSCKDYDEDIDAINSELTNIKSQIAALQSKVDAGNYVTGVTKTADGITFAFSNGSPVVVAIKDGAQGPAGKDGSVVEVKEGVLYINGEATEIKVAEENVTEFKPAVSIVEGEWAVLNEEGEYVSTGILATSTTAVQNADKSWTLTIKDAEGNAQEVKVPSAASLITSIDVTPNVTYRGVSCAYLGVTGATFTKPSQWAGQRELPSNNSRIYAVSKLDVRIDPVSAPAQDVEFYLTNTKNHTLSNLKLAAAATQDSNNGAISINGINGRAAVTGNGLWTLYMNQFVLDKDAAKAFDKDLADNTGSIAYAVNANLAARSKYNVVVGRSNADALKSVQVLKATGDREAALGGTKKSITVNVGQTYKVTEGTTWPHADVDAERRFSQDGLMWDMYFSAASATAVETYGLVFDHLNRTFTVTKRPDVVTTNTAFDLNITTLDIYGNIKTAKYSVSLSSAVSGSVAYDAVEYDLTKFNNNNANDDYFSLPISALKEALGANWTTWANSVNLAKTDVAVYKNANLSNDFVAPVTASSTNGLTFDFRQSNGNVATDVNALNNVRIKVAQATAKTFTVDTQYYIKVTFKNASGDYINHVSVPVTFKAPSVADQFTLKAGYVVDGVVNAYYYDYENASKEVALKHYFDAYDADATLAKDADASITSKDGDTAYNTVKLAKLSSTDMANAKLSLKEGEIDGSWTSLAQSTTTNAEVGYGKDLIIEATNTHYDGWLYKTDDQKYYSFKIKLMSPIFEGTIKPVTGSTINVTANAETGFAITKSMIELADYNSNLYCVVPDMAGTPNNEEGGKDVWKAAQISDVWVTKDANNTYIKKFSMQEYKENAEGEVTQEGAIVLYADPLPNTQETSMKVNVMDCWGYKKAQEVSVTIVKQ